MSWDGNAVIFRSIGSYSSYVLFFVLTTNYVTYLLKTIFTIKGWYEPRNNIFFTAVVFKVGSLEQHQVRHWGTCEKCKLTGPTGDLLQENLGKWPSVPCINNPPRGCQAWLTFFSSGIESRTPALSNMSNSLSLSFFKYLHFETGCS